ncbi:P-loop NTPase fold protein [Streptomyces sp. NBC_00996]|uniref:P-loop NTPase fold protein n=1 Tax=Streptomyces sp. NBC_00996 TaxID=2903710 RepID=UPI0038662333|nr:P-loop NTPase fold protein [Streptomyces sp. NBC_00996]
MAERGAVDLDRLVKASVTRVLRPMPDGDDPDGPGRLLGSGFFVAPGLAITCSHVVSNRQDDGPDSTRTRVQLAFGDVRADGVVEWASPGATSRGARWPLPDLAVIRLTEPVEHACVRLSERPLEPGDTAWGYGFTFEESELQLWTGTLAYQGGLGDALRVGGDTLPDGVAGGPLVDPAAAGVCGVLKSRLSGEGGLAVPLTALRDSEDAQAASLFRELWERHDAYHLNRSVRSMQGTGRAGWWNGGGGSHSGPRARALAGLGSDRPSKVDLLGHEGEVEMLAMLATALTTTPPLAIALLGEWGAGKSSTMEQMHAHVAALTERVRRQQELQSAFVANVRQVRFNAWHYAEEHLWTGLVDHLFRELATEQSDEQSSAMPVEEVRRRRDRLLRERDQAKSDVERLQAAVDAAAETAPTGRASAAGDPLHGPRLLWTEAGSITRSVWSNRRVLLIWIAVLGTALVVWALAGSWIAAGFPLALGAGAAVQPVLRRARSLHDSMRKIAAAAGDRVGQDLKEANERVAVTADRLARIDAAMRVSEFLRRRSEEPSPYEPYRSLLSQVRRDLEQLESDLALAHQEWIERTEPGSRTLPPLQRVILYIDDLDRCSPQRVVEVLAAVHLMLALELFVVVVAVDPQWLIKALHLYHQDFFGPAPTSGEVTADAPNTGPLDYLDKIFQVPFTIARSGEDATARYLRSLLGATGQGADAAQPAGEAGPSGLAEGGATAESGAEDDSSSPSHADAASLLSDVQRPPVTVPELRDLRPDTLQLHTAESDFMTFLGALLPTPRAAKKLVNLYRLARISIPAGDLDTFVATDHQALQVLLAVLVGSPAASQQIFTALAKAPEDRDVRDVLSAMAGNDSNSATAATCTNIVAVLDRIALTTSMATTAKSFQRWIPLVARFSFHSRAWVSS